MKMKAKINFFFILIGIFMGWSQNGAITNHIYEGNEKAESQAFIQAEKSYRKALSLAPEQAAALYNLGTTHFLDKQYDEASQRFFQTQKFAASKEEKHRAFHNMGNVYMQQKEYQKAVEAYKNALRNNPSDEETRYNYALAKSLLEKEEPPQEQEQDDQKDQKDQKEQEDQQEKEQDKEQQGDEGDESKEDGDPKNEGDQNKEQKQTPNDSQPQDKKQAPQKGQLSPEQVQSLLEAMNNQEKKVQDKVNAKKVKGVPVRGKKDW